MNFARAHYLVTAAFPLAASLIVLACADAGKNLWLMHLSSIAVAGLLIVTGHRLDRWARNSTPAHLVAALALAGTAAPLLFAWSGPHRWIPLGPVKLYMAPLLLPSFFAVCAFYLARQGKAETFAFSALIGASLLLALQPDASQVLALLAGTAVLCVRYRSNVFKAVPALAIMACVTWWAFTRPDPLEPVPHVEGVFALALGRSPVAGIFVMACAIVFLARLYAHSLTAVTAYYTVLFGCSVVGLTPAPLIGYGAGPLLGFGLMALVSGWFETPSAFASINHFAKDSPAARR